MKGSLVSESDSRSCSGSCSLVYPGALTPFPQPLAPAALR